MALVSLSPVSIWRVPAVMALLVAAATVAASCSSSPSAPRSKTPLLAPGRGTSSQRAALLAAADFALIPGSPAGVEVTPASQRATLFQDPDARTPCGERVTLPDFSQGAQVQFDSTTFAAIQVVIDLPGSEATSFITAWQKGTRAGCPPYISKTNTGSSQIADLVAVIPMPNLVDQATGTWSTLNDNGQTVNSYGLILRSGRRLEFDVLIAPAPLPEAFVLGFARLAESALKNSLKPS
jgi:hypothetical protein